MIEKLKFLLIFFNALMAAPIFGETALNIPGDERAWNLSGKSELKEEVFLPKGQTLGNWREALLYHHVSKTSIPLIIYVNNFIKELDERLGGLFETRILKEENDFILLEWWLDKELPDSQHGFIQILKVSNGIDFIRYTTKNVDKIEKIKPFWENILMNFRIKPIAKEINVSMPWDLDGRRWVLDGNDKEKNKFILEGETDSKEYVEIETFAATDFTPRENFDILIKKLEKTSNKPLSYRVLFSNELTGLMEWKGEEKRTPFHEWVYFSKEKPGVSVVIRYRSLEDGNNEERTRILEKVLAGSKIEVTYDYTLESKEKFVNEQEILNKRPPWSPFFIREPKDPLFYHK